MIASSDRKLVVMRRCRRARVRALGAQGFAVAGTWQALEMAMPLEDAAGGQDRPLMSYETDLIKTRAHKARLLASP